MKRQISKIKLIISTLVLLAVLLSFFTGSQPVKAQQSIARIQITQVDYGQFPDVKVRAILHDGNGKPVPTSDLSDIEMVEKVLGKEEIVSDELHQYSQTTFDAGVEVMFVLDIAGDIDKLPGSTGEPIFKEMQSIVLKYIASMGASDRAGIIIAVNNGVNYFRPLTADKIELEKAINGIPANGDKANFAQDAVRLALTELPKSTSLNKQIQTIVLLTPALYYGDKDIDELTTTAKEQRIVIHSIYLRDHEYNDESSAIKKFAEESNGLYTFYNADSSVDKLFQWLDEQRNQIEFGFRSHFGDSSERTIQLGVKGGGAASAADSKSYTVTVLVPKIEFDAPTSGQEIRRDGTNSDGNTEHISPTSFDVVAVALWPDSHARAISSAQFYVDGNPVGPPVSGGTGKLQFTWDLTSYSTSGTYPVRLKVEVKDELGLVGTSDEMKVQIKVIMPNALQTQISTLIPATPTPACFGLTGSELTKCRLGQTAAEAAKPNVLISIGSLLVAIIAIVMAVLFRGQLAAAGGHAVDFVRETVTRLTRPASSEAGAYLKVLRGDEELQGQYIPLYVRTVTPVGRSPQEAELVFQLGIDRSVVSRRHCEFREEEGIFKIRDLGSSQGTYVNGIRLPEGGDGQELREGDKIELGPVARGGVLLQFCLKQGEEQPPANDSSSGYDEEDAYKTKPAFNG